MHDIVLDSFAVLAYLFDEPAASKVNELFEVSAASNTRLPITAVNWAEALYRLEQMRGDEGTRIARHFEQSMPIDIVAPNKDYAEIAARLKSRHRISLADAFAAALTKLRNGTLATGDPEFRQLEKEIHILWLPQRAPKSKRK